MHQLRTFHNTRFYAAEAHSRHNVTRLSRQIMSCRWEVIESGAGAPQLLGASLPAGKTGPEVIHACQLYNTGSIPSILLTTWPVIACVMEEGLAFD